MINTYNESSLHKTLKILYSQKNECRTEAECNGYIYDIMDTNGNITEIQTKNLSKLLKKTEDVLSEGKKIKIVHPIIIKKTIILTDENGEQISRRKSPATESIYSVFKELTGLFPILLHKNFSLDAVLINATEIRQRTPEPVQSLNSRRRFRRNWLKTNKKLDEIISTTTFCTASDYISLIPHEILPEFTARTLGEALRKNKNIPKSAAKNSNLMIWVLTRMKLIEQTGKKDRSRLYKISTAEEKIHRVMTLRQADKITVKPQDYGYFSYK